LGWQVKNRLKSSESALRKTRNVGNGENGSSRFDNQKLWRHDGLVSGREALAEDRQRCRPFSLTWLAICLAKPEHLSKSAFATGVQSMRGWLPNRAAPWLNRGLRPLTGIDDSGNAAIRGLLLAKQLAAGVSARTFEVRWCTRPKEVSAILG
jgi:hypothetical protein